jgi:hypothetical protein
MDYLNTNAHLEAEVARLLTELETELMRLSACGIAAMSNTPDSVAQRITPDHPYWSASYGDVCNAVDREMALHAELDALRAQEPVRWLYRYKNVFLDDIWTTDPAWDNKRPIEARPLYAAPVPALSVPIEVRAALNRMCTPLHESRLAGATAEADARCMKIIREYVERTIPADDSAMRARLAQERECCIAIVFGQCDSDNVAQRTVDAIRKMGDAQ